MVAGSWTGTTESWGARGDDGEDIPGVVAVGDPPLFGLEEDGSRVVEGKPYTSI